MVVFFIVIACSILNIQFSSGAGPLPTLSLRIASEEDDAAASTTNTVLATLWFNFTIYQYTLPSTNAGTIYTSTHNDLHIIDEYTCPLSSDNNVNQTKIMITNNHRDEVTFESIKLTTSSGEWYGIDAKCLSQTDADWYANNPGYESWILDVATCSSGKAERWICIDNEDDGVGCGPYQQMYYFDTLRKDQYIQDALYEDAKTIDPQFATCEPTTSVPSAVPSAVPSGVPSAVPSEVPSAEPSIQPTTNNPSFYPSNSPTNIPSKRPTRNPSNAPFTMSPSVGVVPSVTETKNTESSLYEESQKTSDETDESNALSTDITPTIAAISMTFFICTVCIFVGVICYFVKDSKKKKNEDLVAQTMQQPVQHGPQAMVIGNNPTGKSRQGSDITIDNGISVVVGKENKDNDNARHDDEKEGQSDSDEDIYEPMYDNMAFQQTSITTTGGVETTGGVNTRGQTK
eukprot:1150308_1